MMMVFTKNGLFQIKPVILVSLSLLLFACQAKVDDTPEVKQEAQEVDTPTQNLADKGSLSIGAAANLAEVLPRIVEGYCKDKGLADCPIETAFASSGKLYAQIEAGAPYNLYLAANQSYPKKLLEEMADKVGSHQPFTYARGQLTLYSTVQSISPNGDNLALLQNPSFKIAIANPELAPYGEAARKYLTKVNLYDALNEQKRLVMAENIGQAFQFTNTGHVDLGFVALSQIKGLENKDSKPASHNYQVIPVNEYPAILQDGIVVGQNALAEDFASYLQSDKGQAYFEQAGYLPTSAQTLSQEPSQ